MLEAESQYAFIPELKEVIIDKAADFHLGAMMHEPISYIFIPWHYAQHFKMHTL